MPADFGFKGWPHVHPHSLNLLAPFLPEQFEKWTDVLAAASLSHPEHAPRICVRDHRGVAMAFVEGELIH